MGELVLLGTLGAMTFITAVAAICTLVQMLQTKKRDEENAATATNSSHTSEATEETARTSSGRKAVNVYIIHVLLVHFSLLIIAALIGSRYIDVGGTHVNPILVSLWHFPGNDGVC